MDGCEGMRERESEREREIESAALKCHSHVRKKGMYRRSLSSLLSAVVDVGLSDGTSCSGGTAAAAAATRPLRILGHKLDRMSSLPRDFHTGGGASVTSGTGRPRVSGRAQRVNKS